MTDKPNVILIYGDDLGRGMLSCYGQQQFETPNIDRLANEWRNRLLHTSIMASSIIFRRLIWFRCIGC